MRKLLSILLVIVMMSLAACGTESEDNKQTTEKSTEQSTEQVKVEYPVTVTDQAGREVVIESEPQKLVSGYYISSSLLIALGLDDKMVGIEAKADKRPIYKLSAEELIELPSVGSAKEFDLEGCLALEPDLVILPKKLKDIVPSFEDLGINVLLVSPENQKQLIEMAGIIGQATNTVDKANELVNYINDVEANLKSKTADAEKVSVYLAGNSDFLSTAPNGMYQSDMITLAGGRNVAEEIEDTYWAETSYEQVLAWNPEYIIIAAEAEYTVDDVMNDANLADCTAVKNGNVYQIPCDAEAWDSPVPGGIIGSVWLANILHPDIVDKNQFEVSVKDFYEKFYGFNYQEK